METQVKWYEDLVYIKMSHLAFPDPDILPVGRQNKIKERIYIDEVGQRWAEWEGWYVPLYCQDQLQEMVWAHIVGTYNLLPTKLFAFSDYWEEGGIPVMFTSMEQLWLAFVMKELHQKAWDGYKWI